MTVKHISTLILLLLLIIDRHSDVNGCNKHDHHHHDDDDDDDDDDNDSRGGTNIDVVVDDGIQISDHAKTHQKYSTLRRLDSIFRNEIQEDDLVLSSNRLPCKDGEPTFTVGNITYACLTDFQRKGGVCATSAMSPEERDVSNLHFLEWKDNKIKMLEWIGKKNNVQGQQQQEGERTRMRRRNLGGCFDCINWDTTTITIPTYIHVIHSGTTGMQFTYKSNPSYIQNQIKALNVGFRGEVNDAFAPFASRAYPRYNVKDSNTKIQFCLAGTTATDNASWYANQNNGAMKTALKKGGQESLNVYVNTAGGFLGYSYYPSSVDFVEDGVVILNDSMPGGALAGYNEGDTLTHEVGHWLGLDHTFEGGCAGAGDYMDLAPKSANYLSVKSNEADMSSGCQVTLDTCLADSGKKNPIHSFMSYSNDNCMDQFTPGQKVKLQQGWETYRHKSGYSEQFSLASDGFSCVYPGMPTMSPTMQPTTKPTTPRPTTNRPTSKPSRTKRPTTLKPVSPRI